MDILVADDSFSSRDMLTEFLGDNGYGVRAVSDGIEAWSCIRQGDAPSLILLDWMMPGLSGPEICRRIKADPALAGKYVILITGKDSLEDIVAGFRSGADDYVCKPFALQELLMRIRVGERVVGMQHELKERMELLRASEAKYRTIFENIADVYYRIDKDRRLRLLSPSGVRLFGFGDAGEVEGRDVAELFFHDVREVEMFQAAIAREERIADYPLTMRRRDGSVICVETSSMLSYDEQGVCVGIEGIIRDVTEKRQLEESLIRKTENLERAQSELEKTNLDLIRSYAELQETQSTILQHEKMASIGQLAAGMAHEINNPAGFIISNLGSLDKYVVRIKEFMEYLMANPADEAQIAARRKELKIDYILDDIQALVAESLEGALRVKRLVQDLKSFSRVDQVECVMADVNECLESTLNIVWNELKYKARVVKDLGDLPPTFCYPQQLNQVFMNILVNAGHAIEEKGEIRIVTRSIDDAILVTISDSGCGIPAEMVNRIFDPFFTTKDVGQGTGLGLSIAYDIVKKHDGEIEVNSEPGQGTTFSIRIPVRETEFS